MKIAQKKETEIRGNSSTGSSAFSIREEDFGHIIDLMRSKIYANPIVSLCRELASNSRDANREVGRGLEPIEIVISENHGGGYSISFNDSGPGIGPDRMVDVFCNYGASTKRGDNTQTGGFGLGAKSPFAYSDSFTIETCFDDVYYLYVANANTKGTNGRGSMELMLSRPAEGVVGTKVTVPIKNGDLASFKIAVSEMTSMWDVPPLLNFNSTCDFECDGNIILKRELPGFVWGNSEPHMLAIIDGIPYPVNFGSTPEWVTNAKTFLGATLCFRFKIGTVGLISSRENIINDDKNLKYILGVANSNLSKKSSEVFSKIKVFDQKKIITAASNIGILFGYRTGLGLENKEVDDALKIFIGFGGDVFKEFPYLNHFKKLEFFQVDSRASSLVGDRLALFSTGLSSETIVLYDKGSINSRSISLKTLGGVVLSYCMQKYMYSWGRSSYYPTPLSKPEEISEALRSLGYKVKMLSELPTNGSLNRENRVRVRKPKSERIKARDRVVAVKITDKSYSYLGSLDKAFIPDGSVVFYLKEFDNHKFARESNFGNRSYLYTEVAALDKLMKDTAGSGILPDNNGIYLVSSNTVGNLDPEKVNIIDFEVFASSKSITKSVSSKFVRNLFFASALINYHNTFRDRGDFIGMLFGGDLDGIIKIAGIEKDLCLKIAKNVLTVSSYNSTSYFRVAPRLLSMHKSVSTGLPPEFYFLKKVLSEVSDLVETLVYLRRSVSRFKYNSDSVKNHATGMEKKMIQIFATKIKEMRSK